MKMLSTTALAFCSLFSINTIAEESKPNEEKPAYYRCENQIKPGCTKYQSDSNCPEGYEAIPVFVDKQENYSTSSTMNDDVTDKQEEQIHQARQYCTE